MSDRFEQVSVGKKGNVYFDGRVASHSVWFADGSRKTLGFIHPGTYVFDTDAPETMEITAGSCRYKLKDGDWVVCSEGSAFKVPGKSSFEIKVEQGFCQYICSFG
jgi:uncharacterized protein YaiE (UPF0345 family)